MQTNKPLDIHPTKSLLLIHHPMTLEYLDFDYSEDEQGIGNWDAMASVQASRVPALAAEIESVLTWAHWHFEGRQGAIDDGGDWDYDLQSQDDEGRALTACFDSRSGKLDLQTSETGRTTVCLSLAGSAQFGVALTAWLS